MTIRATSRPATSGSARIGPPSVRDQVNADWPGIPATHPTQWCPRCTRAFFGGRYVVKHIDEMCDMHGSWVRRA